MFKNEKKKVILTQTVPLRIYFEHLQKSDLSFSDLRFFIVEAPCHSHYHIPHIKQPFLLANYT